MARCNWIAAGTIAIASLILPFAANAEPRDFGSAGGFDVFGMGSTRDEPGGCIATFEYAGPGSTKTTLLRNVEEDKQDLVFFTVVNFEWTAKEKESYSLTYSFDDSGYDRDAIGVRKDIIYKGFIAAFPADEFLGIYAKSRSLRIYMGDSVVDKLTLTGSSAGMDLFNRCWTWVKGTERTAQAERDRYKDIPRDPFANERD